MRKPYSCTPAMALEPPLSREKVDDEAGECFVSLRQRFPHIGGGASGNADEEGEDESSESFGFGEGYFHTFNSFKLLADRFKRRWFGSWEREVTKFKLVFFDTVHFLHR